MLSDCLTSAKDTILSQNKICSQVKELIEKEVSSCQLEHPKCQELTMLTVAYNTVSNFLYNSYSFQVCLITVSGAYVLRCRELVSVIGTYVLRCRELVTVSGTYVLRCRELELISEDFPCPNEYFKCAKGHCVAPRFVCDGSKHCIYGDDEINCGK
jgi:hypothetical protein